jgi:hydrogenase maturation protease
MANQAVGDLKAGRPALPPCDSPYRVTLLGLGDVVMRDDAMGPYVIRMLEATYDTCPGITLVDSGMPGFDLESRIAGKDAVIIVGTVRSAGTPGQIRLYQKDDILWNGLACASPLQPGLKETLLRLEEQGKAPREVLLVGVIPLEVHAGAGLSSAVRAAVPTAMRVVVRELIRLQHVPVLRPDSWPADIWWETPPVL